MAKQKEDKQTEFVNPFTPNLTYKHWLQMIPKDVNVKEYLTNGGLTDSEVTHILNELELINNK